VDDLTESNRVGTLVLSHDGCQGMKEQLEKSQQIFEYVEALHAEEEGEW